jgi:TrmH family RNA methyltransferase
MGTPISSRHNKQLKLVRSVFRKKGRSKHNLAPLEGVHAVTEALEAGAAFDRVFAVESLASASSGGPELLERLKRNSVELVWVDEQLVSSIADTESPQGITALVHINYAELGRVLESQGTVVVALAGLQDPGNLGTLVRSAECLGARGVVVLPGTVDPYNPKVLRSTAGALFRLPLARADNQELLDQAAKRDMRVLAAEPRKAVKSWELDWTIPSVLIIGNEARGIPRTLSTAADRRVAVPMQSPVDSLNAAMAATILMYEALVSAERM